jgi:hypothetical protein
MKHILDTSEMLGTVEVPSGRCEVCASADASFDESAGRLTVKLEAFLRPADFLAKERRFHAPWLPKNETLTEPVDREESHQAAREIFQSWVRKVREAAPPLHQV